MNAKRVLLDEVEKAVSGKPLQALNDILSQRQVFMGPFALNSAVETAFGTTNLVPASFVHNYHLLGLRSTAEPFLDRFPIKIWIANYLAQAEERRMLMMTGAGNTAFNAFRRLQDPRFHEVPDRPILVTDESSLPEVDWGFLGDVAYGSTFFRPDLVYVLEELVDELRNFYNSEAIADETDASLEQRMARKYPPNLVSNRTLYNLAIQSIIISSFHELLSMVEAGLQPDDILQMIEKGIPLDRFSVWRIASLLLYSAPGNPRPEIVNVSNTPSIQIDFGKDVEQLKNTAYSLEEQAFLTSLIAGRNKFSAIYKIKMEQHALHGERLADRLRKLSGRSFGPSSLEQHSLELWLLKKGEILGIR